MKTKLTLAAIGLVTVVLLATSGCSTTGSSLKCPDLAMRKSSHVPLFAKASKPAHQAKSDNSATASVTKPAPQQPVQAQPAKTNKLMAYLKGDLPLSVKIPKMGAQLNDDQIDKVNTFMGKYSNNHVALVKNEKGKVFLKATSAKEFIKLTKQLAELKKNPAAIDDNVADILALVGFICGIVAIGLCLIPFADFISVFPAGPAGVVLGILGLKSERHKKALIGIILGGIGFVLGIVSIVLYFSVFTGLFFI